MAFTLTGTIMIECCNERLVIPAKDFSLEEADSRHLGDGDYQYETLYIYFDHDDRFKVLLQVTEFQGQLSAYSATLQGQGRIIADELGAEAIWADA
jgi:hypothetical protein